MFNVRPSLNVTAERSIPCNSTASGDRERWPVKGRQSTLSDNRGGSSSPALSATSPGEGRCVGTSPGAHRSVVSAMVHPQTPGHSHTAKEVRQGERN